MIQRPTNSGSWLECCYFTYNWLPELVMKNWNHQSICHQVKDSGDYPVTGCWLLAGWTNQQKTTGHEMWWSPPPSVLGPQQVPWGISWWLLSYLIVQRAIELSLNYFLELYSLCCFCQFMNHVLHGLLHIKRAISYDCLVTSPLKFLMEKWLAANAASYILGALMAKHNNH